MIESETLSDQNAERHRPPVEHILKCWPDFFKAIRAGKKKHDLRRATDRLFREGDTLLLREFDPKTNKYTGDVQRVLVTYITSSDLPCALSKDALHKDFCILSIERQ